MAVKSGDTHKVAIMRVRILPSALLVGLHALGGCGSGEPPTGGASIPTVATIQLTSPAMTVVVGGTIQFTATPRDAVGNPLGGRSLAWSSSNPAIATVTSDGLVTGIVAGDPVTISVSAEGRSASAPLRVVLAELTIAPDSVRFSSLGAEVQLVAAGRDANGGATPSPALSWRSQSPGVATVSADGLVRAIGNGTTVVTATSGPVSAQVTIIVAQVITDVSITGGITPFKAIGGTMQLTATPQDARGNSMTGAPVVWSSSASGVADITATGLVTSRAAGTTTIQALIGSVSGTWEFTVQTVFRVPVDPYLATPAAGAQWEVPVVVVAYIPTADGVNLDVRKSPDFWALLPLSLDSVEQRVLDYSRRRKMMIEEGSRFRGYRDPGALPAIGYRVVEYFIVYDIPPPSNRSGPGILGSPRFPDFFKVFADLGLSQLINGKGVREVWFAESSFDASFPSYDPAIHKTEDMRVNFESNMSSPTTGDISNSFRWNDDLPILNHTYVLYGVNFRRSQAEAVHNVGHQLEAMLGHANWLQDGNTDLFWKQFVGQNAQGEFITGRAGWTHMPPNTTTHYDYLSPTNAASDIEDWRPDATGARTVVNRDTWGTLTFPWPGVQPFHQQVESQWYTYWMQNFPGRGNQIPHGSRWMTNWWAFVGDWDAAIASGLGLHGPTAGASAGSGEMSVRSGPATSSPFVRPHPPTRPLSQP